MIGIISYLPDEIKLRKLRLDCLKKTIEYLRSVFPNELINIVDQNYCAEDRSYIEDSDVCWYMIKEGIGPSKARNYLLKKFYTSQDRWLVLTDDDNAMYDYYDVNKLFSNIYSGLYDEYPMDLVIPISPQIRPFKKKLIENDVENYFIFKPASLTDIPNFLLLKNNGKELYYNESLNMWDRSNKVPEDAEFLIRQMLNGQRVVVCECAVKKNLALDNSTLFPEEDSKNPFLHRQLNDGLKDYVEKNYYIDSSMFARTYNQAKRFRIPREQKYDLPEKLKFKEQNLKEETTQDRRVKLF